MTTAVDPWYPIVTALAACVAAEVAQTAAGAPDRVCPAVPGEIAWDSCDCGQLALSVERVYPAQAPPAETAGTDDSVCAAPYLVAAVTVSMVRCVPGPADDGTPPACADLAAAAQTMWADLAAVRAGLGCCLRDLVAADTVVGYSVGASDIVGPEGGCAGSSTRVLVWLPNCACPPG
jgi:hypothetical protein